MIFNETCHRCLQHLSHLESQLICCFPEFVLIEPCHRAREAYRQFRTVVEVDISHEKLCEAVDDEIVDFRYVPMPGTERREGSQKPTRHWFAVNFLYDGLRVKLGLLFEQQACLLLYSI